MSKCLEMIQQQQIPTQIRTDDLLASSIQRKLDKARYQSTTAKRDTTSFREPSLIRERNMNFYQPQIISIGPYHRDCEGVKRMETEKPRYVDKMLNVNREVTLHVYLEELRKLEPAARRCYSENIEMSPDEFVELLLYDACIIIQLILSWSFPDFDIVSDISWNIPLIKSDLLMLENQIPFFVLQRVFDLYTTTSEVTKFNKHSLFYLLVDFLMHKSETLSVPEGDNSYNHLLDFYYLCYIRTHKFPMKPMKKSQPLLSSIENLPFPMRDQMVIAKSTLRMIPNATKLQEAEIIFKKGDGEKSIFRVHFSHGVLSIPSISLTEETMPQFMNLIVYEQSNDQQHKPFTRYAVFMYCILKIPRDVQILEQNGIIENTLGKEKVFIEFFNQFMCSHYQDNEAHHLHELFVNMKNYCNFSPWQKYKAKLFRGFSTPWSIIPVATGGVLVLLTCVQTLYAVVSYYRP